MQGRRMGAIARSAVGRGVSGGSKSPATWICIAASRVVDHGSRGSEGRSSRTLRRPGPPTFPPSRSPLLCSELCPRGSANRPKLSHASQEINLYHFYIRGSVLKGLIGSLHSSD